MDLGFCELRLSESRSKLLFRHLLLFYLTCVNVLYQSITRIFFFLQVWAVFFINHEPFTQSNWKRFLLSRYAKNIQSCHTFFPFKYIKCFSWNATYHAESAKAVVFCELSFDVKVIFNAGSMGLSLVLLLKKASKQSETSCYGC